MNIVVIGCSGFIGQYFVDYCIKKNKDIIVYGIDLHEPCKESVINNKQFHFQKSELNMVKILDGIQSVDAVINFASIRYKSGFDSHDMFENIRIAKDIFDACRLLSIRNIVTMSSQSVYSNEQKPWQEDILNIPLNDYGLSKALIDNIAYYYNGMYDMKIKCLRLAQVLGFGERKGYLLNTLIDHAVHNEQCEIIGDGSGKRQYVYIKDVVDSIYTAMMYEEIGGVYNVGMKGNISIIELAKCIYDVFDCKQKIKTGIKGKEDKKTYLMDVSKIKADLGWEAKYMMGDALKDMKKMLGE